MWQCAPRSLAPCTHSAIAHPEADPLIAHLLSSLPVVSPWKTYQFVPKSLSARFGALLADRLKCCLDSTASSTEVQVCAALLARSLSLLLLRLPLAAASDEPAITSPQTTVTRKRIVLAD